MPPSSHRHSCFCFFSYYGTTLLELFSVSLPLVSVAAPSVFSPVCPLSVRVPWELPEFFSPHLTTSYSVPSGLVSSCLPGPGSDVTLHHPWSRSIWLSPLSSELQPVSPTASCVSHRQIRWMYLNLNSSFFFPRTCASSRVPYLGEWRHHHFARG